MYVWGCVWTQQCNSDDVQSDREVKSWSTVGRKAPETPVGKPSVKWIQAGVAENNVNNISVEKKNVLTPKQ